MLNKRIYRILFLFLVIPAYLSGQSYDHPYSYLGIGEIYNQSFTAQTSLGGANMGWNDRYSFTPYNPASYSNLEMTSFSISLKSKMQYLKQDDKESLNTSGDFGHFALGFPMLRKMHWNGSFGLLPVSNIGYKNSYSRFIQEDSLTITDEYNVQGGFSKFYLGTSIQLFNHFNVGANVYYLFGNVSNQHNLEFDKEYFYNVVEESKYDYGKLGYDIGLQAIKDIRDKYRLTIGATWGSPVDLNMNEQYIVQTYEKNVLGIINYRDSIDERSSEKNVVRIPQSFGAGFMFEKTQHWRILGDYKSSQWSQFDGLLAEQKLVDSWEANLGFEITPDIEDFTKYLNRVHYRFGIKYAQPYLSIENTEFQKVSVSFGAGFPMIARTFSRINLGLEAGSISAKSDGFISETYLNIYLGLRLNDNTWFIPSKID